MTVPSRAAIGMGLAMFAIVSTVVSGQTGQSKVPPLLIESMYGPDLFRMYCASCHGQDGRGSGPTAGALKVPPPDLTVLARRQNGVFPRARVELIVRGPATASHGSDEMPVWGPIFRALEPSDARVHARIRNLVDHIASIQQR
jgi:mono/diheme cytochrome c family protein